MSVNFTEGQDVTAGQLLFEIDPRALEGSLRQAEAQLAKDMGQSKTAELQRTRYTNLQKSGLVSQAEFDTISAQANSLLSTINADNVAIENIKLQLQFTKIHSPVTGRAGALLVHKGAIVRTADVSPMVVINQIAPVFVTFAVPARSLSDVRAQQARGPLKVSAVVAGSQETPSTGSVTFIDNDVDAASDTIRSEGLVRQRRSPALARAVRRGDAAAVARSRMRSWCRPWRSSRASEARSSTSSSPTRRWSPGR